MDREKIGNAVKDHAVRKTKRTVKRKAKAKVKRIHPLSFVVWILVLAAGLGAGMGACTLLCMNDRFVLNGDVEMTVPVQEGKVYEYTDRGATVISFGRDRSDEVKVSTNMEQLDPDTYSFDASKEGVYYMIYTIEDERFGQIRRVRTFYVGGDA